MLRFFLEVDIEKSWILTHSDYLATLEKCYSKAKEVKIRAGAAVWPIDTSEWTDMKWYDVLFYHFTNSNSLSYVIYRGIEISLEFYDEEKRKICFPYNDLGELSNCLWVKHRCTSLTMVPFIMKQTVENYAKRVGIKLSSTYLVEDYEYKNKCFHKYILNIFDKDDSQFLVIVFILDGEGVDEQGEGWNGWKISEFIWNTLNQQYYP